MTNPPKTITTTDILEEVEKVKKLGFGEVKVIIVNGNIKKVVTATEKTTY